MKELVYERDTLKNRVALLRKYIAGGNHSEAYLKLLDRQLSTMITYIDILDERISQR